MTRLLAIEAVQNGDYYLSRYAQVEATGAEVFVLNGIGQDGWWADGRYRTVGSRHIDDIVQQAKDWHAERVFDGVLTFSESAVLTVAVVAEALGLPGIGLEAARASRNKLVMRRSHEREGVPHPQFRLAADVEEALAAAEEFGYPVVLKPTLGAASSFVFRVDDADALRDRYAQTREGLDGLAWYAMEADGVDPGPYGVLVESFLDGSEHLIEAVAWDGEVFLGSIVDRVTVEGDTFDDDVHHAPTALTPEQVDEVHGVVAAAVRAHGTRRSVLHAEIRFHQGRPHLIEMAVRPGGGGLDQMARLSAGHDPVRAVAHVAAGARPGVDHYRPTGIHTAALCLLGPAGRLEAITVPDDVSAHPDLFFLKLTARPGDVVRRPPHGNTVLGFLGTSGTSLEDTLTTATQLAGRIDVRVSPLDTPADARKA